jgi:hypothetical protein
MISTISSAFCTDIIFKGEPLSFTGEVSAGLPKVKPYNGERYCGVSCHNVVKLDLTKQTPGMFTVQIGGKINVAKIGTKISIERLLIDGKPEFDSFLKPIENGWIVTSNREGAAAQVLYTTNKYVEVNLI